MFNFFKPRCPICKMELEKGKVYPEGWDKKFCSEDHKEEYGKQLAKQQSRHSGGGGCH